MKYPNPMVDTASASRAFASAADISGSKHHEMSEARRGMVGFCYELRLGYLRNFSTI